MGLVLGWIWFAIGYIVMQCSANVWVAVMLPNVVARARRRIELRPVRSFFAGLGITALFLLVAQLPFRIPQGFFLGFLTLAPLFAASLIGGAAWTGMAADRIQPLLKSDSRFVALVGGALTTTFATLLPVIGWFLFLPVLGLIGTGAGFLAWVSKREVGVAAAPTVAAPPMAWPAYGPQAIPAGSGATPAAPAAPTAWTAE